MVDNIEKVLERGEKIELLVDKTDNLRFQVRSCLLCGGWCWQLCDVWWAQGNGCKWCWRGGAGQAAGGQDRQPTLPDKVLLGAVQVGVVGGRAGPMQEWQQESGCARMQVWREGEELEG